MKTYWVGNEDGQILNPDGRPFRSLDRAKALAARAAEECSWKCLTPPSPDNEVQVGKGNFRCGVLSAHGVYVESSEGEGYDVPEEKFVEHKGAGAHIDWTLEVVVDRGTDTFYFSGPERTDEQWSAILLNITDGDEIVGATVQPTSFGRYADESGNNGNSYPMKWRKGYGF